MNTRRDIQNRDDVVRMVDLFYDKVRQDELLAPVFSQLVWPKHMPTMYSFWSSILLGDQSYQGNPFQKHIDLPITGAHFERWLKLFTQAVQECAEGPVANEAVNRAKTIAALFQHRLGLH